MSYYHLELAFQDRGGRGGDVVVDLRIAWGSLLAKTVAVPADVRSGSFSPAGPAKCIIKLTMDSEPLIKHAKLTGFSPQTSSSFSQDQTLLAISPMSQANSPRALPSDYLERVYAGVLGKLIGVYLGRPFEGWTHQRILAELGHVRYYVHEKLGQPLVVTDDDVSGTFQFIRALKEHGVSSEITAENIGRTWLNTVVEDRTIFWWGGRGMSTEHTAYLNLKAGMPAPLSGAIETNGRSVAEQIGAQIFIDGWALVSPGNPSLAAKLAKQAGSVSHDGESVYAAQLWAAMEAEAFVQKDINHLLDTGLSVIPPESLIARVVYQVREWVAEDGDWMKTRDRIEATYGYDKYHGVCHVVPNHAIMIMTIAYAGHNFDEAMHIINTSGWDTDCNAGNVGCLVALISGLASFDGEYDWRGPLADRALLSTAEPGYSVNDAARIAFDISNMGRQLAGQECAAVPKNGAQFHFTLPGSVQGFEIFDNSTSTAVESCAVRQETDQMGNTGLRIHPSEANSGGGPLEVSTPVFGSYDEIRMTWYQYMGTPLLYPGQTVNAKIRRTGEDGTSVKVTLRFQIYAKDDRLKALNGPSITLTSEEEDLQSLQYLIPDIMDGQPICRVGLAVESSDHKKPFTGAVWLDSLGWKGVPQMTIKRPSQPGEAWFRSWINGASKLHSYFPTHSLIIVQNTGEGTATFGTREWDNYRVLVPRLKVNFGSLAGITARVQGLNRYYALVLTKGNRVSIIKAFDEKRIPLASAAFEWSLDGEYDMAVEVEGDLIRGRVNELEIIVRDTSYGKGGIGLVVTEGAFCVDTIHISPL